MPGVVVVLDFLKRVECPALKTLEMGVTGTQRPEAEALLQLDARVQRPDLSALRYLRFVFWPYAYIPVFEGEVIEMEAYLFARLPKAQARGILQFVDGRVR
jgi:hypothetical protein